MTTTKPKRLIEVAMPIKEISAESVRDKSIRHGHISTLHLWWARRPLPVCRAVIFASLVPDPEDENCPQAFRDAVKEILGQPVALNRGDAKRDWYKPYDNIPWTAVVDPMEDNLRNRLLMFIGKFSEKFIENEKQSKTTPPKEKLSEGSLIRWEARHNEHLINMARKLIWMAHNTTEKANNEPLALKLTTYTDLAQSFEEHIHSIKTAETELYNIHDRHIESEIVKLKEAALQKSVESFLSHMPKVFDPFAGGGAIPLEAARLGCRSYANDLNPVAHIIQIASLEYPQKYGKKIIYSEEEFLKKYGTDNLNAQRVEGNVHHGNVTISNRLSNDVNYYSRALLKKVENEIGQFYPTNKSGDKPIAYYWSRVGICGNPTCRAQVPLIRQFYLVNKNSKQIYLNPIVKDRQIDFSIKEGSYNGKGYQSRGTLICPCCGNITSKEIIKDQSKTGPLNERLLAVIEETENGKNYRLPTSNELELLSMPSVNAGNNRPKEKMQRNSAGGDTFSWGYSEWGQLYSDRQLRVMNTFVEQLHILEQELDINDDEYKKAIITYLAIFIDRIAPKQVSFIIWDVTRETISNLFGRQAIPMIFDYPESNPFCSSSGSANNQLDWIRRYIESESSFPNSSICSHAESGDINQFDIKSLDGVITDPPYYDAIAYADLSDFFYVWMKRTISHIFPNDFATPQTPKTDECTALKHHHGGDSEKAINHFETKLKSIFSTLEKQTEGPMSIMFAHQSTRAWTTLCNSLLGSEMNMTSSWSLDSEYTNTGLKANKAFLTSSVTVTCFPVIKKGIADFQLVQNLIESRIKVEVKFLYRNGLRGADLLTACFGLAVSEFGKYQLVEKADGSEVSVAELLEMARDSAFNAIISDIDTDEITRFYIGWLNLFGFSEADHDDVTKITQIGLNVDVNVLLSNSILIHKNNKESLASFEERITNNSNLGEREDSFSIDKAHKAMYLFKSNDRRSLLAYIQQHMSTAENAVWRVLNSLKELTTDDDLKQATGLLAIKDNLIREARQHTDSKGTQIGLDL